MEQIIEAKSILKDKNLQSVLAESIYNLTEERLNNRADQYINNPQTVIYAIKDSDAYKGIVVIDISIVSEIEILDIAVSASFQKSGMGSLLINHCIKAYQPNIMIAETDDEAVGFYKK